MSVAEKALARSKEKSLAGVQHGANPFGMVGLTGFDESDVDTPSVRLVQTNSNEVTLSSGEEATPGMYLHETTRDQFETFQMMMVFIDKWTKEDEETGKNYPVCKVSAIGPNPEDKPFNIFFTKSAYYKSFKSLLNELKAKDFKAPWEAIVEVGSEKIKGEKGSWFSPTFKIIGETTELQRKLAESIFERFSTPEVEKEDVAEEEFTGSEDITSEEVPF